MTPSPASTPGPPPAEIYEASLATDGTDAVDRGTLLSRAQAEARRRAGQDIVVCGADTGVNCQLAREIEAAVTSAAGKCIHHGPHLGMQSLPHWQQRTPPPAGHSFYETHVRHARTKS